MLYKILYRILTFFCGSTRRMLKTLLAGVVLILFAIMMVIRIFWNPIEYFMMAIGLIIAVAIIWRKVHVLQKGKSLEKKLDDVEYLMSARKYDKALVLTEKILAEDISEQSSKSEVFTCLFNKAQCLIQKVYETCEVDKYKELIALYEQLGQMALELKRNSFFFIIHKLGVLYSSLGIIQNDKSMYESALEVYNNGLVSQNSINDYGGKDLNIASIHVQIGACYVRLSEYENKEYYLNKALAEYEGVYDLLIKENSNGNYSYIQLYIGSVLRRLNEIKFDENRKSKALDHINLYMESVNSMKKKLSKEFYYSIYYNYADAYYELYKLNKADEYLEKFKEYEIKARECSNIRPITIIELDKKSKEIGV